MSAGAIIAAAGMSTRMEQFKQLMKLGGMSFAERVICSFRQAGVNDIIMITGYRAEELERQLHGLGVVFLRNENYAETQMFDSIKIGLRYVQDKFTRLFFCPVDVPLFQADTVRLEMTRSEDIIFPICHNRIGHPVMFNAELVPQILDYNGRGGLKGALDSIEGSKVCYLPVSDEGSIMDADNKDDLQYLIDMQDANLLRADVRVYLAGTRAFFDPDTRLLLRQIEITGSVQEACRKIGHSYSKGWKMIHILERETGLVIVQRKAGGVKGGKSFITENGLRLLELYELLERRVRLNVAEEFSKIFSASDLFPNSSRERSLASPLGSPLGELSPKVTEGLGDTRPFRPSATSPKGEARRRQEEANK